MQVYLLQIMLLGIKQIMPDGNVSGILALCLCYKK